MQNNDGGDAIDNVYVHVEIDDNVDVYFHADVVVEIVLLLLF